MEFQLTVILVILLLVSAGYVVYQLFLHPLARFPGPPIARVSYLAVAKWTLQGRFSHTVQELHKKFGPVVRIGPNTLSFSTVQAARAIYGNKPLFLKNEMYDAFSSGFKGGPSGLFPERNPDIHAQIRQVFAPCFFDKELHRQEPFVQKYVDLLVARLKDHEFDKDGIDINFWARSYVSDVISDLSFGQAFGSLETGTQHFWVSPLRKKFIISAIFETCRRYPLLRSVYWYIYGKLGRNEALRLHSYSSAQIKSRLASTPRVDYIGIVNDPHRNIKRLDLQVLRANLYGLIIGATETTSFAITTALYFLSKNPDVQKRLANELRNAFATYSSITLEEAEKLPYMRAVVDEALRMLPPSPLGGMRVSPGTMVDNHQIPSGTEILSSYISLSRSSSYFQQPDTFMPERWIDSKSNDARGASLAFSLGPRNCIGRPLALMKVRLAVTKIVYGYELSLVDGNFDLEERSKHYGGPWITPPVMLNFRSRRVAK